MTAIRFVPLYSADAVTSVSTFTFTYRLIVMMANVTPMTNNANICGAVVKSLPIAVLVIVSHMHCMVV